MGGCRSLRGRCASRNRPNSGHEVESQDETRKRTTDISEWDQKFIAVDHWQETLFEIILAANYLDIKPLLSVPRVSQPWHIFSALV
ncbi:hypothetical protein EDB92DRAFT_1270509 [Lactarius akahatsu]|uniref:Uncharacterized protein n=1 Tax=Lactarius akahatsu TaxID=416441 RepID=A0AAD4LB48_9AGAM|nr:hypothetical protein EDB92DRAFT_1807980 [Lactarius akahatsu]KAH8986353.1 hypothetical protein EDB92DRAFT_1270509 [Lactarius akahatsu]